MRRHVALYRNIVKTFGWQARPLATFALLNVRHAVSAATLALDRLVVPEALSRPLDRPIFILGSPRSGSTFLHRTLVSSGEAAGYALWEMLFPAVTARRLLGGAVDLIAPFNPARFHDPDAHDTGLRDVETDDAMLLFRFLDGPFLWSYFHAWQDHWGSAECQRAFGLHGESTEDRARIFDYLDQCWRRNAYVRGGQRVVVKSSTFTLRVRQVLARWPDARLVLIVRDPLEAIPSGMSMLENVIARAYGPLEQRADADRRRWLENLYQASLQVYRQPYEEHQAGLIPPGSLHTVTYPQLITDLEATIRRLMTFLDLPVSPAFEQQLREAATQQRSHRSRHSYALERFGLTRERILADLGFVYVGYGLARPR